MVCKNCKRLLPQQINFCNGCGGKVIRNRLTMRNLLEDFACRYLNYDNKFFKTIKTLFTKPEEVIESYIHGTRKRYVDAIGFFTIALTFSGLQLFILNNFFPNAFDIPDYMTMYSNPGSDEAQKATMSVMQKYQSLVMMSYIPIYALMAKIVFFNIKRFNFTELLVVFLYTQGQISIFLSIITVVLIAIGVDLYIVSFTTMPFMLLYFAYALKRLYRISTAGIILRSMGFAAVFIGLIIFFGIVFAIWMQFSASGQEMIEAQKAVIDAAKINN